MCLLLSVCLSVCVCVCVCLLPSEAYLKASWWLTAAEDHKSDMEAEFLTQCWHSLCQPWNKDVAEQEVKAHGIQPPPQQQQPNIHPSKIFILSIVTFALQVAALITSLFVWSALSGHNLQLGLTATGFWQWQAVSQETQWRWLEEFLWHITSRLQLFHTCVILSE